MASHEGQYNPRLVTCSIAGAVGALNIPLVIPNLPAGIAFPATVVGRAADNFFNVTNAADMVSMAVGAEGNATHVINNDETGNISIVLTRGSFFNRVMSILFRAQRLIGEGQLPPFTFGVKIRDNNAVPATQHTGLNCMILRQPDDAFGASDGEITWGFVAAQIVSNYSGRIA
jgi:hypothetical protein